MKKLSIKNSNNCCHKALLKDIAGVVISDGFSGFRTNSGTLLRGACTACDGRFCYEYSNEEVSPTKFQAFEKNPSRRVCPSDAIFIENNFAHINTDECIKCGLCLHRCPYAAVQFSIKNNSCYINDNSDQYSFVDKNIQDDEIQVLKSLKHDVEFEEITQTFCSDYQFNLREKVKRVPDISEITVRNSLINLGCTCATKPAGNNHIRTEFFAELDNKIIIGESEVTNSDTLSVCRRILDDLSVLISRNGFNYQDILPIAVINGLPNKRTDFYEVISDINNVLGIQISTITYYLLFVLNLFNITITITDLKKYVVGKDEFSLINAIKCHIKDIQDIDHNISDSGNFMPLK